MPVEALTFEGSFRSTRGRRAGSLLSRQKVLIEPEDLVDIQEITALTFLAALRQEQAEGDLLDPTIIVDGSHNKSPIDVKRRIEAVDVSGVQVEDIVRFVYDQLIKRSPRDTGRYMTSHVVMYNGRVVNDIDEVKLHKPTDKIEFVNPLPYAKKIEQGLSAQAPKGVYRPTAIRVGNVYRRIIKAKFTYRPISRLGNVMSARTTGPMFKDLQVQRRIGRQGQRLAAPVGVTHVYPVIQIWAQAINSKSGRVSRASHARMRFSHSSDRIKAARNIRLGRGRRR